MLQKKYLKKIAYVCLLSTCFCTLYPMQRVLYSQKRTNILNQENNITIGRPLMVSEPDLSNDLEKIVYRLCPQRIKNVINSYQYPRYIEERKKFGDSLPRSILLYGSNKSLKSKIPELIAKQTKRKIISVVAKTIRTRREQLNLARKILELSEQNTRIIVTINNAEIIDQSILRPILDDTKKSNIFFIFTTNDLHKIATGVVSRIGYCSMIEILEPNATHCKKVLEDVLLGRDEEPEKPGGNKKIVTALKIIIPLILGVTAIYYLIKKFTK